MFSDSSVVSEKIVLIENDKVIRDDQAVSEHFNHYFANITDTLKIAKMIKEPVQTTGDPIQDCIQAYSNHPSILRIKGMVNAREKFEFSQVDHTTVFSEIQKMNATKKTSGAIPTDKLKLASNICYKEIAYHINNAIEMNVFPDILKLADVSPIFKNGESTTDANYRPISVLSSVSKIYERLLSKQILPHISQYLSDLLCGFREKYSTQDALIRLIERCRKCLDKHGIVGMVLMDLSKAYDCLPHDLLVAKLEAYGFSLGSLRMLHSYLTSRKQRIRIDSSYSSWLDITSGVPQGSVLGPLLFNIYINDLIYFIEESEICDFADDNTLFACDQKIERVISSLEIDIRSTLEWFESNMMVANPSKFQLMFMGLNQDNKLCLEINEKIIPSTNQVKLLGITIDAKLKFDTHVESLCVKANRSVSAFSRVARYLQQPQKRLLYNSFVMSNFKYCPLIWMFCGKGANNKINKIHKRALSVLFDNHNAPFADLLVRSNEKTVHVQNLQRLMIEIYKTLHHENPLFLSELFQRREIRYNLRIKDTILLPSTSTVAFGMKSICFRGSILWNSIPDVIKSSETVASLCKKIKTWAGEGCNCKLCSLM